jgi:hypothetical protein
LITGLPTNAFKTIIELGLKLESQLNIISFSSFLFHYLSYISGGIETEGDYPYDGRDEKCHFNRSLSRATIDSYVVLPQNEVSLAQWLYKYGPISIGINANAMQFYFGGISHPLKFMCNPKNLDHGVLIVGFGVAKTRFLHKLEPYWLIKNSWGSSWGEKVFIFVESIFQSNLTHKNSIFCFELKLYLFIVLYLHF